MGPMTAADIREGYQRFFEQRGHTRVPPAPLLARDDPTLLFVNSGMAPFKRVLTGEEKRDYVRAVDSQPCLRVAGKHNDFEEVGRTPRHQTLFEMLGNWSFGDYFKRDAIHWAWEYLTDELGIPAERIAATVYTDDEEAHRVWADEIGLPPERLVRWGNIAAGDEKNFWRMGDTGPCGPCSELHYDRGAEFSEGDHCIPDHSEHCPRWLEVWNLVFMEFDRAADGSLTPLPFKSVDTGMGLERISSVVQEVDSNYRTDLFAPIIERLAQFIGHDPATVESERFSYQVVADHSRAMTFLIAEGVSPSNEGPGYVLRRIMRRAVRHGRLMGITQPFLRQTCAVVIEIMGGAYAQLAGGRERILAEVEAEEAKFARTLQAGSEKLLALVEAAGGDGVIPGDEAFRLHDTFGFPIDLTVEIAAESGVSVDREGFERAMAEQRDRSRGGKGSRFTADPSLAELSTEFIGYPNVTGADGLAVMGMSAQPEGTQVVLDRTPFYAEGGGQIGDRGELVGPRGRLKVDDTQRIGDAIVHVGKLDGELEIGEPVEARVDEGRRWAAARNHTATHLLHRALRDVLGEQAKQAGSWVGPEALRFDFPSSSATPREQLREVERRVNEQIRHNAPVRPEIMSLGDAQSLGADMFFGEKYIPESVRVVQVDGYSKELCGGTHVAATGQIGSFRITGESSIGTGLRRIEAVTGDAAEELVAGRLEALHRAAAQLGVPDEQVPARVEALTARLREAEKAAREPKATAGPRLDAAAALAQAQHAGDTRVIVQHYPEADAIALRAWADDLRGITGRFVAVAAGAGDGPALLVAASRDLAGEGFDSVKVIRAVGPMIGGGGGGRPELAQAGGRDASRLQEALAEATRLALEALQPIESSLLTGTDGGAVQQIFGGVVERLRGGRSGRAAGDRGATGPQALTALDVGTEFAKALVVGLEEHGDVLTGVVRGAGRQRQGLTHMQSGTVSDIDAVVANCRTALDEAEGAAGLRPGSAVIGIAGELVKGTTSVRTVRRDQPQAPLTDAELERIVQRAQSEALDEAEERIAWESGVERMEVRLVHAAIVEMKIDGYPVSNPIGFTGTQLELAVFNAFAPMVHLGALQSVAQRLGLQLLGVIAEPYAVATCLDPGELGDAGAVFVDIGGGTTDVALVRHGGIAGTKMLALGGRAFTKGLAERFGLSFTRAELLKLAAAADELPESVPAKSLQEALAEDAAVWRRGVELMVSDLAGGELLPARIYLCGGGAELPQIVESLADDGWWRRLPFARRPQVTALRPDDVAGLRDATASLSTRQDVTPMALAHQALILDSQSNATERAMRRAVRALQL